tara:strand:+ start:3178 stop:3750 length:573 start_codon:yes stop_codon:yes gene_type:complete
MSRPFWNEASLEPKRKFRWLVYAFGNEMPTYIAKSVTKPAFNVGKTEHQFLQHTFKYPGRITWQPITLTIVDPVTPDATQSLYNAIRASGYELPPDATTADGHRTISKESMVNALGPTIKIEQIGIEGSQEQNIIEQWIIRNPIMTSVTFDSLDYTSDELLNVTIGIEYDFAELNTDLSKTIDTWVKYQR